MTKLVLIGVLLCGLAAANPALVHADKDSAQKHLKRAIEYYQYGRYDSAAIEFERAYHEDAAPRTLFAWAQAARLAGQCERSIELYQQFLETKPPDSDVEAAEFGIKECQAKLREDAANQTSNTTTATTNTTGDNKIDTGKNGETSTGTATHTGNDGTTTGTGDTGNGGNNVRNTDQTAPRRDDSATERPWYLDRQGLLFTTSGGVVLAASLGIYISARSLASNAASDASNEAEFDSKLGSARVRRNFAVIGGGIGAALTTLGLLRYHRVRGETQGSVTVTPVVDSQTAGILLHGRF